MNSPQYFYGIFQVWLGNFVTADQGWEAVQLRNVPRKHPRFFLSVHQAWSAWLAAIEHARRAGILPKAGTYGLHSGIAITGVQPDPGVW